MTTNIFVETAFVWYHYGKSYHFTYHNDRFRVVDTDPPRNLCTDKPS